LAQLLGATRMTLALLDRLSINSYVVVILYAILWTHNSFLPIGLLYKRFYIDAWVVVVNEVHSLAASSH
jgi:hypothetical protein